MGRLASFIFFDEPLAGGNGLAGGLAGIVNMCEAPMVRWSLPILFVAKYVAMKTRLILCRSNHIQQVTC